MNAAVHGILVFKHRKDYKTMKIKYNIDFLDVLVITPFLVTGLLCFVLYISTLIPKVYTNKKYMNSILTIVAGSISIDLFIIFISNVMDTK